MNNLFRNNYTLEEISAGICPLCNGIMDCNAFSRWCGSMCQGCGVLKWHFIKTPTGYQLTDILWNLIPERRFYAGSENNIWFVNSYPRIEFEIESFDRETLLRIDEYLKKRSLLNKQRSI